MCASPAIRTNDGAAIVAAGDDAVSVDAVAVAPYPDLE
jgi:hypothetical protein